MTFDWEGFHQAMEQHGDVSGAGEQEGAVQVGPARSRSRKPCAGTQFLGYETTEAEATIVGIVAQDQLCDNDRRSRPRRSRSPSCSTSTPFYGESGGQVGDTGELVGDRLPLRSDRHAKGRRLHRCTTGICAPASCSWATKSRPASTPTAAQGIRRAHSATHILHYALQKHLGHARPAARLEGRRRLAAVRFRQSGVARRGERSPRSKREVNDKVAAGRAGRLADAADRRGPRGRAR